MNNNAIIIYDGDCALCNSIIRWILKHDNNAFKIADQHTEYYKEFISKFFSDKESLLSDSIYLFSDNKLYKYSEAVIQILLGCGKQGKLLAYLIMLFPANYRNKIYQLVARNRKTIGNKYCKIIVGDDLRKRLMR